MKESTLLTNGQPSEATPKRKLSKKAYELLLEELVTWRLQPGDIVLEAEIASRLGTSKTPVREALRALVAEGFLRVVPRAGYVVLPVTEDDVRDIFNMRLLLEGEAAALTAQRIEEAEVQEILQDLESHLKVLERQGSEEGKAPRVTPDHNTPYHLGIAQASGSPRLHRAVGRLLKDDRRVIYYRNSMDQAYFTQVHVDLLDEIRSGDPDRARLAMRRHIEESRTGLRRWFASTDQ